METTTIRVWQIGPDGTEYFAAHSEDEMKDYYRRTMGIGPETERDLTRHFEEVENLDEEFAFNDDGHLTNTTWRTLAESASSLPCQISTGYN